MTAEERDRRRVEAERNAAADWCSAMPKDDDARKEPFVDLAAAKDDLKAKQKELKDKLRIGTFEGTLKNHGWEKDVVSFFLKMEGKSQPMQTRIWRQMQQLAEDMGWNAQNDLFASGEMGETRSDGAVFDKTKTGGATADMTSAPPKQPQAETGTVDTGKLDPADAVVKFEEAGKAARERRAKRASAETPPAAVPDKDPDDPRPRHLRQAEADRNAKTTPPEPEAPEVKTAPKKAGGTRKRPASPAAQAAKDLGIGEEGKNADDDSDDHPGNFRISG